MNKITTTISMVADERSRLNPNAPIFVPKTSFDDVEDFSPEWWDLVKTSPRFREYWLSQQEEDDFISISSDGCDYVELEDLFYSDGSQFVDSVEKRELPNDLGMDSKALLKNLNWNLDVSKSSKGRVGKAPIGPANYCEKKRGNKRVSAKCTAPRRIHQPR